MKTLLSFMLCLVALNIQAQDVQDTIKVRQDFNKIYFYQGKRVKPNQMLALMKPNPAAYLEMKKANTNFTLASILGFTGGFLLGYSLGSLIINEEFEVGAAALGTGLIGLSIPFSIGQAKHTKKAVRLYNDALKSNTASIQWKLKIAPHQMGIVAHF